jgi:hypothetical protein
VKVKEKIKFVLDKVTKAEGEEMYSSIITVLAGGGGGLPPGKTRYTLYTRMGGTKGRSGQVRKISPPMGFEPRISHQDVASRYTD